MNKLRGILLCLIAIVAAGFGTWLVAQNNASTTKQPKPAAPKKMQSRTAAKNTKNGPPNVDVHIKDCMGEDAEASTTIKFYADDRDYRVFLINRSVFKSSSCPSEFVVKTGTPTVCAVNSGSHKSKYFVRPTDGSKCKCDDKAVRSPGDPNDITVP